MTQNYNATECHLWSEDPNRCQVILIVQQTFSSLALIACMITAVFIVILRKYKSTTGRLIFWLSVSSVLRSLVFLLTDHDDRDCRVKGFFHNYFNCTSLLWVFMIAVNCLLIVKRKNYEHYFKWYHIIVWLGSMVWSTIPLFSDSYGHAGLWCWIGLETDVRFGMWYVPLFILCFCMILIYVYLLWFVMKFQKPINNRSNDERTAQKRMRRDLKSLLAYPFLYILFSIPIFIYRLNDATDPYRNPNYGLTIASVLLTPLVGVVYTAAFVVINANLKEISVPLLREGLRDIFRKTPRHTVNYNFHVNSLPRLSTRSRQYQPNE